MHTAAQAYRAAKGAAIDGFKSAKEAAQQAFKNTKDNSAWKQAKTAAIQGFQQSKEAAKAAFEKAKALARANFLEAVALLGLDASLVDKLLAWEFDYSWDYDYSWGDAPDGAQIEGSGRGDKAPDGNDETVKEGSEGGGKGNGSSHSGGPKDKNNGKPHK
jgi:hypothetical protein